jgi:hypothetical protein
VIRRAPAPCTLLAFLLVSLPAGAQQDLGHKVLGVLGIDAGVQRDAGLYLGNRLIYYHANRVVDREGTEIPVGLNLDAIADALGAAFTWELRSLGTFLNAAVGVSFARVKGSTERPETSIDRLGLGDLFVQPLALGWRVPGVDLVAGYAFYAPTGRSTPGGSGGVGRGHWTHQLSIGGTVFFDENRAWRFSLLGSHDWNQHKRDIDITRGDTVQIQGGVGGPVHPLVVLGLIGYALWQVEDDHGSDLPAALRGARDRAFGLGAELSIPISAIRLRITTRYAHDLSARSRPQGGILSLQLSFMLWKPPSAQPAPRAVSRNAIASLE